MELIDTKKIIKDRAEHYSMQDETLFLADALNDAVECMERQIPKNPKWGHHCPNCEIGLAIPEMLMEEYKALCMGCCYPKYCPDCGQRLDWGEDAEYEAYQDEMEAEWMR